MKWLSAPKAGRPLPNTPRRQWIWPGKKPTLAQQDAWLGMLLMAPVILFVLVFVAWPTINTLRMSFFYNNLIRPEKGVYWIGLENYATLLQTGHLAVMWLRTVLLAFATIAGQIVLGLSIALMLNRTFILRSVVRSTFIVPWALPTLVAAFAIRWLFDANFGPINQILALLGLPFKGFPWLGRPETAQAIVISAHIWKGLGYLILLMLAGLQTIPFDLRDAARVDGANAWQEFRFITLPHLEYIIAIAFVLRFIWTFNWFDLVFLTTSGGPSQATMTLPVSVYITAFKSFNMGKAAAIASVMTVTLAVFSILFFKVMNRQEED
jgi:multiple sugar transport system permease protein